jgi:hypothetical protein
MKADHQRLVTGSNAFGSWKIDRWTALPPEAPVASYVLRWKSATEVGYSIHPTREAALAAVPFTNEGYKQCPLTTAAG